MNYIKYFIQQGQTDWTPREPFCLWTNFKSLTWTIKPDPSMHFDYGYPDQVDNDWQDIKKIGGISLADFGVNILNIFNKSRDSIQMGWRSRPDAEVHEFFVYHNNKGENVVFDSPAQVLRTTDYTEISMRIEPRSRREYANYLYVTSKGYESVNPIIIHTRKNFNLYSRTGLWYGGANDSPGRWGGAAPKDMTTYVRLVKN